MCRVSLWRIAILVLSLANPAWSERSEINTDGIFTVYRDLNLDGSNWSFVGSGFYLGDGIGVTAAHVFYDDGQDLRTLLDGSFKIAFAESLGGSDVHVPTGLYGCALISVDPTSARDICFFQIGGVIDSKISSYDIVCPDFSRRPELQIAGFYDLNEKATRLLPSDIVVQSFDRQTSGNSDLDMRFSNAYIQTQFEPRGGLSGAPIFDEWGRVVGLHSGEIDTQLFTPFVGMEQIFLSPIGIPVFDPRSCNGDPGTQLQDAIAVGIDEPAADIVDLSIMKRISFLNNSGYPVQAQDVLGKRTDISVILETQLGQPIRTSFFDANVLLRGTYLNDYPPEVELEFEQVSIEPNTGTRLMVSFGIEGSQTTYVELRSRGWLAWLGRSSAKLAHPRYFMIEQRKLLDQAIENLDRCSNGRCQRSVRDELAIVLIEASGVYDHWLSRFIREGSIQTDCCSDFGASTLTLILKLAEAGDVLAGASFRREAQENYTNTLQLIALLDEDIDSDGGTVIGQARQSRMADLIGDISANYEVMFRASDGSEPFLLWASGGPFQKFVSQEFNIFSSFSEETSERFQSELRYRFAVLVATQIGRNAISSGERAGFDAAVRYCSRNVACQRQLIALSQVNFSGNDLSKFVEGNVLVNTCSAMHFLWKATSQETDGFNCDGDPFQIDVAEIATFEAFFAEFSEAQTASPNVGSNRALPEVSSFQVVGSGPDALDVKVEFDDHFDSVMQYNLPNSIDIGTVDLGVALLESLGPVEIHLP